MQPVSPTGPVTSAWSVRRTPSVSPAGQVSAAWSVRRTQSVSPGQPVRFAQPVSGAQTVRPARSVPAAQLVSSTPPAMLFRYTTSPICLSNIFSLMPFVRLAGSRGLRRHVLALGPGDRLPLSQGCVEPGDKLAPCGVLVVLSALGVIPVRHVPTAVQIEACLHDIRPRSGAGRVNRRGNARYPA